jgi:hypothetical protein
LEFIVIFNNAFDIAIGENTTVQVRDADVLNERRCLMSPGWTRPGR